MAKSLAVASIQILSLLLLAGLAQSEPFYTHLDLYSHEFRGNTSQQKQSIYPVAGLPNVTWGFLQFGTLFIGTYILKETISFDSPKVGYLHSIVGVASLDGYAVEALSTARFTSGRYSRSTLVIQGVINGDQNYSAIATVGGISSFDAAIGKMNFYHTEVVNATGHNVYKLIF